MFSKEVLRKLLNKDTVKFISLSKSIGFEVKPFYNAREVIVMLSYVQKTETHSPCVNTLLSIIKNKITSHKNIA